MNEYDSSVIANMLENNGWHKSELIDAQLVIVNTCAVRQNAEDRAIGRLLTIAGTYPNKTVGIIGCVAKEKGDELLEKYRLIDFAIGPGEIDRIIDVAENKKRVFLSEDRISGCGLQAQVNQGKVKAFVAITRGCENYCSYCIVPYVRGKLRSRPINDVISEIKNDIALGIKEITLLGQNVNSYYDTENDVDFADLLDNINDIEGLERIRFLTNHPKDMSNKIIDTIRKHNKICKSIHLPVQSGSTKILKAMNRGYSREQYLELIDKIKNRIGDIAISTDIITGFPGESEYDFEQTVSLYEIIKYASSFAFRYSVRQGTKAEKLEDDVPEKTKINRLKKIIDIGQKYSYIYSNNYIGNIVNVLVEESSASHELIGFEEKGRKVVFYDDNVKNGDIIKVKINEATKWLLKGEII